MVRGVLLLVATALVAARSAHAIGESSFNANSFTSLLGGIGRMFDTVNTKDVDTERLMGRWHQMYKAAINFDVFRTQMFCPVSYFTPNRLMGDGGFTVEEAYRVVSKSGPIETYKRDVSRTDVGKYWMYTEEYFYPSQFHIIAVGPHFTSGENGTELAEIDVQANMTTLADDIVETDKPYDYFIATDANRLRLEVYARDPAVFYAKYNEAVLAFLGKNGFGGGSFWNSPQPIYQGSDCQWPTQREVFARRVLRNQQQAQGAPAAQGGIGSSIIAGINPSAALQTFQGLFGQRTIQPQFGGGAQPQQQATLGNNSPTLLQRPPAQRSRFSTFQNGPTPQFNNINRNFQGNNGLNRN